MGFYVQYILSLLDMNMKFWRFLWSTIYHSLGTGFVDKQQIAVDQTLIVFDYTSWNVDWYSTGVIWYPYIHLGLGVLDVDIPGATFSSTE